MLGKWWPPPRRDGVALGFGMAYVFLGVAGLVRSAGVQLSPGWFYPAILVSLGVAGLISLSFRPRAGP